VAIVLFVAVVVDETTIRRWIREGVARFLRSKTRARGLYS
jgi:hypothetical protein